jgi:DNA polymerase
MIVWLDLETFSETPISSGTHAYAEAAEVMLVAWALDDGPVLVFDRTYDGACIPAAGPMFPPLLERALADPANTIVIHNSSFDRVVLHYQGVDLPPERIEDTAVQALSHGLPAGLDKLCNIFKVPEEVAKHQGGKELIRVFCTPQPKTSKVRRRTALTDPAKWEEFKRYAGGDIHAMRYLHKHMPRWNYPQQPEHALWCLDQRINDRGFQIDLELAEGAIASVKRITADQNREAKEMTEGRLNSTRQRDKLLAELCLEYGVYLPDLTSSTIERRLEDPDLPEPVKELLANRLMVSSASTAKFNKVVKAVGSDGRLRGALMFSGAARTKRWSGRLFQPQNLPRPDMKQDDIDEAVEAFRAGAGDIFLDEPMRAAWNCLRGLIVAKPGHKLVQADLSGIEARILPWLAGEDWKLQAFRDQDAGGYDVYTLTAARLLGIDPSEVTKEQRQAYGKVVELACGYGGAGGAFAQFAALYRIVMEQWEIGEAVRGWRDAHRAIADWDNGLWAKLDRAAREAIHRPGSIVQAGEHIAFEVWRGWMKMHLPSGGFLSYASPKIIADERMGGDTVSFMGVNNYTRKWERITTYGGKLSADATQSTARELLAANLPGIEEAGYPIILLVHDEAVTEPVDNDNFTVVDLCQRLARRPEWIDDKLPLAAGGFEAYRYRKD